MGVSVLPQPEEYPLTAEERGRVRSFRTAFNRLEKQLRRRLRVGPHVPFLQLVRSFDKKFAHDLDIAYLTNTASLRNLVAHAELWPHDHLAVPTLNMISSLEAVSQSLWDPVKVLPTFRKRVETISSEDTLKSVLQLIYRLEFSQFPVSTGRTFTGLLTENGITRWLADFVVNKGVALDADAVSVRALMREEEDRENYEFVPKDEEVQALRKRFSDQANLEAVLITADGSRQQPLLGIVTTWDIMRAI